MEPEFVFDSACSSPFLTAPSSPSFFFPKSQIYQNTPPFDRRNFEFDFSGFSNNRCSVSDADDLFREGRIKPRVQFSTVGSSPIESLSPKKNESDPFEEAVKPTQRGGERKPAFRVSDVLSEETEPGFERNALFSFSKSVWKRYKKWKIKDVLFRNASEGKSSSFRSVEGSESGLRRKGSISAHYEAHYTVNRAVQEEMKKRTSLPYKHGLMGLGCLGLEPPVQDLVRSFGSSRK